MHAALDWFAAHVLGGLLTAVLVGGGHLLLTRRHSRKLIESQTRHLDERTDAQTAELKDGSKGGAQ